MPKQKKEKKVTEILEEVVAVFCNEYCKYPYIWDEEKERLKKMREEEEYDG